MTATTSNPEETGELNEFDFGANDVGIFLLESITKGLYRDPRNSLREYISNELDNKPRPTHVDVNIRGDQVEVIGDGPGMGYDQLRMAVRVGFSPKDPAKNIGFRGIGIYSGVSVCDRIRIATKQAGTLRSYVLTIDAEGLRADMDSPRQAAKTPLVDSLRRNVRWAEYEAPAGQKARHRTVVTLVGVLETASSLLDEEGLRVYLENTVPIELHPRFPQRKKVERFLMAHVRRDYRLTSMSLNGTPLHRSPNLPDLYDPETGIINIDGKDVGCYWFCLSQRLRKIRDPGSRGFLLRKKGFSIGDRTTVQKLFQGSANLVGWVTGEIHVTSSDLWPNAERVELEQSPMRTKLENWIVTSLGPEVSQLTREESAANRASIRVAEAAALKTRAVPKDWSGLLEELYTTRSLMADLELDRKSRFVKGRTKGAANSAYQQAKSRYEKLSRAMVAIQGAPPAPRRPVDEEPQGAREAEAAPFEAPEHEVDTALPSRPALTQRLEELCGRVGHNEWSELLLDVVLLLIDENHLPDGLAVDAFLDKLELRLAA